MKWERRYRRHVEELRERVAELEAELDASGVEDALEWERFPEYERLLYALVEREVELMLATSAEVAERDEIIELAEQAHESAMTELEAFGESVPWFDSYFEDEYVTGAFLAECEAAKDMEAEGLALFLEAV